MTSLLPLMGLKNTSSAPAVPHKSDFADKSPKHRFLKALMQGRFAEAEIILINNPGIRKILINLPGLRHTAFFKNSFKRRIGFYKNYAEKYGIKRFDQNSRLELRDQFAMSHCKTRAISDAAKKLIADYERGIKLNRLRKLRRKKRRGLFFK